MAGNESNQNKQQPKKAEEAQAQNSDSELSSKGDAVSSARKATNSFTLAIIAAVVIAVGLIVLGLTVYKEADQGGTDTTEQTTEESAAEGVESTTDTDSDVSEPVQSEDIDQEVEQIDSDLNQLSDDAFNEEALNDEQINQ